MTRNGAMVLMSRAYVHDKLLLPDLLQVLLKCLVRNPTHIALGFLGVIEQKEVLMVLCWQVVLVVLMSFNFSLYSLENSIKHRYAFSAVKPMGLLGILNSLISGTWVIPNIESQKRLVDFEEDEHRLLNTSFLVFPYR